MCFCEHCHFNFVSLLTYFLERHFPSLSDAILLQSSIKIRGFLEHFLHQTPFDFLVPLIEAGVAYQIWPSEHCHFNFVWVLTYLLERHFPLCLVASFLKKLIPIFLVCWRHLLHQLFLNFMPPGLAYQIWPSEHCHFNFVELLTYSLEIHLPPLSDAIFWNSLSSNL